MSELTPQLGPEIVAASQAGAEEAAGALSRSLDAEFSLTVGETSTFDPAAPPTGFDGPGLAIMMRFGEVGAAALLPESSGLLPEWYSAPDVTGESKLSTLAQELSMLFFPESMLAERFMAARVENLSEALANAKLAAEAGCLPMEVTAGEGASELTLLWPLESPQELFPELEQVEPSEEPSTQDEPSTAAAKKRQITSFSELPGYSQSLLRIELPVRVVLASKKENLHNVVELAAGSIIKFSKACDEMLDLQVGDHKIAVGEAVKVGDKFGFRVSSIVMPEEHFMKARPTETN